MLKEMLFIGSVFLILLLLVVPKYINILCTSQKKLSALSSQIIETTFASLEYSRIGHGIPIIISHGITGGFDQGLGMADLYIGQTYDYIAVSRFGYLKSSLPKDSSPQAQADSYFELLNELNIEKTFIFGNSAGGTSAIQFALKYPERCLGLILVSSVVPSDKNMPPKFVMKAVFGSDFIYWTFSSLMGEKMLSMAGGIPDTIIKRMTHEEKRHIFDDIIMGGFPISERTQGVINDMFVSNPRINNNYPFDQIKVPVLMISAKDDSLCDYRSAFSVSEQIPNVEFVDFDNGGHIIFGHEKEIQSRIAAFIRLHSNNQD